MNKSNKNNLLDNPSQLYWACRRGMLELDIMLGNFLSEAFPTVSKEDQALFVRLLACPDPDIFAWLMGKEEPDDKTLQPIIDKIRQHARSRI